MGSVPLPAGPTAGSGLLRRAGLDAGDLDLGEPLTVPLAAAVAGLVLELPDVDLGTLGGGDDPGRHGRLGQGRAVAGDRLAVDEEQDRQLEGRPRVTLDPVDL